MKPASKISAATAVAFVVLLVLVAVEWSPLIRFDYDAVKSITDTTKAHSTYRSVMTGITEAMQSGWVMLYTAAIALVIAIRRRYVEALWLAATVGIGNAIGPLLKLAVDRDRPTIVDPIDHFSGLSYPSGHAGSSSLTCAALLVLWWPALSNPWRVVAVALAILIPAASGWSRLSLGAHYPSDLAGGYLLGVAWVAAWLPLLRARTRSLESG